MGELGFEKILLIAVVVLLLFGAKRLPEVGASLGKGIREFKRSLSDITDATSANTDTRPAEPRRLDHASAPPSSPASGGPKRLSE